jgi:outer membrane biosynthesis protein TonB
MTARTKGFGITLVFAIACAFGMTPRIGAQSGNPKIIPPRPTKLVQPDCSEGKACHGIHGDVTITVTVRTDGTVGDTYPKGTDQVLMDAAEEAARHCKFEPGKFAGKPTSMNYDLHYKF